MIAKLDRKNILDKIVDKDEKIIIASCIDKANKFLKTNMFICTNFLEINKIKILTSLFGKSDIEFTIVSGNRNSEKQVIFFVPDYLKNNIDTLKCENICCIKIIPRQPNKVAHKDYMGAIYSLGIKRECIGDIYANSICAYVFCMSSVKKYITDNLVRVSNQNVLVQELNIFSNEVQSLDNIYVEKNIIVSSLRCDAILSELYNLSRAVVKDKIASGELYVNSNLSVNPSMQLCIGDIISFRKCGKAKFHDVIRETNSGKFVISIKKYS